MLNHHTSLVFENLRSERDDRVLFENLGRSCPPGTLLRVAGPNGAGKTTLLRILAGLFEADEGAVKIDGAAHRESLTQVLYLGHKPQVSRDLTVMDNLFFLTGASSDELRNALKAVGLNQYHDSLVRELSQGQGRRCALARLWCAEAPIWILDEPYTALDVDMVGQLDARINQHVGHGGICLFTTHQPPQSLTFETLGLGRVG